MRQPDGIPRSRIKFCILFYVKAHLSQSFKGVGLYLGRSHCCWDSWAITSCQYVFQIPQWAQRRTFHSSAAPPQARCGANGNIAAEEMPEQLMQLKRYQWGWFLRLVNLQFDEMSICLKWRMFLCLVLHWTSSSQSLNLMIVSKEKPPPIGKLSFSKRPTRTAHHGTPLYYLYCS